MTPKFSALGSISFGWKTFKARPAFFVGSILIYAAVQYVLVIIEKTLTGELAKPLLFVIGLFVATGLSVGFTKLYLKAHDDVHHVSFTDARDFSSFWQYFATSVVLAVVFFLGVMLTFYIPGGDLLIIIPSLFFALTFSMAPYIIVEKKAWTVPAFKESWKITKGSLFQLLILGALLVILNILGAIPFLLGLLITAPVSMLAMAHVYRALSSHHHKAPEEPVATVAE